MKKLILLCSFAMLLFVSPDIQADTLGECAWGAACGGGGGLDGVSDISTSGTITGKKIMEVFSLGVEGSPIAISASSILGGQVVFSGAGTDSGLILPVIDDTDAASRRGFNFCIINTSINPLILKPGSGDKFRLGASVMDADEAVITVTPHTGISACWVSREFGGSCLLYTSPSPRDRQRSRMPSSA